jgi:hypothetical protein
MLVDQALLLAFDLFLELFKVIQEDLPRLLV